MSQLVMHKLNTKADLDAIKMDTTVVMDYGF